MSQKMASYYLNDDYRYIILWVNSWYNDNYIDGLVQIIGIYTSFMIP